MRDPWLDLPTVSARREPILFGVLLASDECGTYRDPKPVFFGHYWLSGEPRLESPTALCLDYSIAKDGALVAYRWSGEAMPITYGLCGECVASG